MTEEQCVAGDWYGAGLEDGAAGRLLASFDERAGVCSEFGVRADYNTYKDGRDAGLSRLCTDAGGFEFGSGGSAYWGVCSADAEPAFLGGYLTGKRRFFAAGAVGEAEDAYESAVSSVDYHQTEIRRGRATLDDPDASEKQIRRAKKAIEYSRNQLPYARRTVDDALYNLGRAEGEYDAIIASEYAWRTSNEFSYIRDILVESHEMARRETDINYCTDESRAFTPVCFVRGGGALRDLATGEICAFGPATLSFVRRTPWRAENGVMGHRNRFDVFPHDPESGRVSRRPASGLDALFEAAETPRYVGASCEFALSAR